MIAPYGPTFKPFKVFGDARSACTEKRIVSKVEHGTVTV